MSMRMKKVLLEEADSKTLLEVMIDIRDCLDKIADGLESIISVESRERDASIRIRDVS